MSKSIHEKLDALALELATIKANQLNDYKALKEHKHDLGAHAGPALAWGTLIAGLAALIHRGH